MKNRKGRKGRVLECRRGMKTATGSWERRKEMLMVGRVRESFGSVTGMREMKELGKRRSEFLVLEMILGTLGNWGTGN